MNGNSHPRRKPQGDQDTPKRKRKDKQEPTKINIMTMRNENIDIDMAIDHHVIGGTTGGTHWVNDIAYSKFDCCSLLEEPEAGLATDSTGGLADVMQESFFER